MDAKQIPEQAARLRERLKSYGEIRQGSNRIGSPEDAAKAQVCEFLRQYAGASSEYLKQAEAASGHTACMSQPSQRSRTPSLST